eukprot:Opistho-2@87695
MVVYYEVNLSIDADTLSAYKDWLFAHVAHMLKHKGFQRYEICELDAVDGRGQLSVRYTVASMEDLEDYFANHAAKMREEGLRLFPNKFSASRRILRPIVTSDNN